MPARSPFSSPHPNRLYRNPMRGKVFGVCAGLADLLGTDALVIRVGVVVALFFFSLPVIITYLLAALILPARPPDCPTAEAAARPQVTPAAVRHRYHDLEQRVRGLERHVASHEFEIGRAIRDLDR